jgi:hypothetical protein
MTIGNIEIKKIKWNDIRKRKIQQYGTVQLLDPPGMVDVPEDCVALVEVTERAKTCSNVTHSQCLEWVIIKREVLSITDPKAERKERITKKKALPRMEVLSTSRLIFAQTVFWTIMIGAGYGLFHLTSWMINK